MTDIGRRRVYSECKSRYAWTDFEVSYVLFRPCGGVGFCFIEIIA